MPNQLELIGANQAGRDMLCGPDFLLAGATTVAEEDAAG